MPRSISKETTINNVLTCVEATELTGPDFLFFLVSPYSANVIFSY